MCHSIHFSTFSNCNTQTHNAEQTVNSANSLSCVLGALADVTWLGKANALEANLYQGNHVTDENVDSPAFVDTIVSSRLPSQINLCSLES